MYSISCTLFLHRDRKTYLQEGQPPKNKVQGNQEDKHNNKSHQGDDLNGERTDHTQLPTQFTAELSTVEHFFADAIHDVAQLGGRLDANPALEAAQVTYIRHLDVNMPRRCVGVEKFGEDERRRKLADDWRAVAVLVDQ